MRICNLDHLDLLADLAHQLGQSKTGQPASVRPNVEHAAKKNGTPDQLKETKSQTPSAHEPPSVSEREVPQNKPVPPPAVSPPGSPSPTLSAEQTDMPPGDRSGTGDSHPKPPASSAVLPINKTNLEKGWQQTIECCGDMTADMASQYRKLELSQPDQLVVTFKDKYTSDMCSRPERKQKLEAALRETTGQSIRIDFAVALEKSQKPAQPQMSRVQIIRELEQNPLVKSALELFDGEITDFPHPDKQK